jgi:hypothetical protein
MLRTSQTFTLKQGLIILVDQAQSISALPTPVLPDGDEAMSELVGEDEEADLARAIQNSLEDAEMLIPPIPRVRFSYQEIVINENGTTILEPALGFSKPLNDERDSDMEDLLKEGYTVHDLQLTTPGSPPVDEIHISEALPGTASSAMSICQEEEGAVFHRFKELPEMIRSLIWSWSYPGRFIEVLDYDGE